MKDKIYKTSEAIPPFREPVKGWKECEACDKGEDHFHDPCWKLKSTYCAILHYTIEPEPLLKRFDITWHPYEPKYWAYNEPEHASYYDKGENE